MVSTWWYLEQKRINGTLTRLSYERHKLRISNINLARATLSHNCRISLIVPKYGEVRGVASYTEPSGIFITLMLLNLFLRSSFGIKNHPQTLNHLSIGFLMRFAIKPHGAWSMCSLFSPAAITERIVVALNTGPCSDISLTDIARTSHRAASRRSTNGYCGGGLERAARNLGRRPVMDGGVSSRDRAEVIGRRLTS